MANFTGSLADAGRLIHIAKRRERHKEDIEKQKKKLQEETSGVGSIGDKFKAHYDAIEHSLKTNTVGLVTLEQMRATQQDFIKRRELQLAHKSVAAELTLSDEQEEHLRLLHLEEQQKRRVLSFADEGEEGDEGELSASSSAVKVEQPSETDAATPPLKKKKLGKDPTVDTSFLPDKEREEAENRLREELRQEWAVEQERVKNEEIRIAFSYWDGSGHRRDLRMSKGHTISQFLQKALDVLRKDFNELKIASADSLMFVKEDLIIAHFYTFHDFIVTRAQGKTGPLFEFAAAGELRVRHDAACDTAESHPAKVVLRAWYERNKHIYPASQWEPFVPHKQYARTVEDLNTL